MELQTTKVEQEMPKEIIETKAQAEEGRKKKK